MPAENTQRGLLPKYLTGVENFVDKLLKTPRNCAKFQKKFFQKHPEIASRKIFMCYNMLRQREINKNSRTLQGPVFVLKSLYELSENIVNL